MIFRLIENINYLEHVFDPLAAKHMNLTFQEMESLFSLLRSMTESLHCDDIF